MNPVSTMSVLIRFVKQFITFWALVLLPTVLALLYIIYQQLPLLGAIAAYGALATVIAYIKSSKTKVEVTKDLKINTVRHAKVHPDLLKTTLIVNAIFTIQAFGIYLMFVK